MRLPSLRSLTGNLLGLALLGAAGAAFAGQIIQLPSGFVPLISQVVSTGSFVSAPGSGSSAQMQNIFGWVLGISGNVFSSGSSSTAFPSAQQMFSALPSGYSYLNGGQYVPCVPDTASTVYCWSSPNATGPVVVPDAPSGVPEPSGFSLFVTAVAAIAFAIGRWRTRRAG